VAGLWERVQAERRCELVTIVGEAGVGKSRLAAELLSSSEARVVRGRCLPYGEGITYWPVVEVLKQLDVRPADEAAAAPIRSLLVENDRVARAEDIAWAFRKTLEQAARKRPLVVFLDDIHWGEEAFLDLLEQTALLSSGTPALLLCLARPELVERRPTWPVTLRLEPLGDSEVEQLIPERISGALRAKIVRAAGGNPLYIDEMLTMAEGSDDDVAVPPTLHALLAARLDQLDPGERTVLERAAVEGETFHWGAVRELAPDDAGVASSLASLVRKGLIRPDRALLLGEDAFRFTHLLIRDAAYDRILKETRARLHERFAVWLEEHGAELVTLDELLGYHLEQAHGYLAELGTTGEAAEALAARAARHLGAAGRLAVDRGDVHAAANLLRRATALLPPDDLDRLRLLPVHGYALKDLGRTPEAWVVYDELDERATALGERGLATRGRLGRVVFNTPGTAAWEAGEQLMETFTELGDEAGLAEACRGLATVCRTRGRAAEAAEWNERALAHADACGDRVVHRVATQGISMALCWGPVPAKQAIARCEELRETNRDDRVLDAVLARHLSSLYAMAGRYDDARTCWERGSLVLDEANILSSSWVSLLHSAGAKELAGDRAGAKHDLQSMWLHTRDAMGGAPDMRAMTAAYLLANLYCDDGRWDEAEECLAFHGDASVLEDAPPGAYRFAGAARIAAHRGELAAASTLARTAVEIAAGTDMLNLQARTWLAQAEVHSAAGEAGLAEAAVATALELYERKGNLSAAGRVRTSS
jgi:tetratricopeptide (TPR) repeat protein